MRYGVALSAAGAAGDPRTMADLAALAEESGWDAVFLEDYIVWQGHLGTPTYDPWVVLAAMAVATTRVRLGTLVTPLPRRRPWKLASEAVTLDHLSGGRVVLGVGAGDGRDISFTTVGDAAPSRVLAERLDEGIEIVDRLWTGEKVSYAGTQYQVDGLQMLPTPVQQPRIPVWVGGNWLVKGVRRRLARWDGACVYRGTPGSGDEARMSADDVRQLAAVVEGERGSLEGFDICLGGDVRQPDWDRERAHLRSLAEAGATWWQEWVPPGNLDTVREAVARGPLRIE